MSPAAASVDGQALTAATIAIITVKTDPQTRIANTKAAYVDATCWTVCSTSTDELHEPHLRTLRGAVVVRFGWVSRDGWLRRLRSPGP